MLVNATLRRKKAPRIGAGKTVWGNSHLHDISNMFDLLVQAAVGKNLSPELWGANGYYFTENGYHVWGELAQTIANVANKKGYITSVELEPMGEKEALDLAGFEAISW